MLLSRILKWTPNSLLGFAFFLLLLGPESVFANRAALDALLKETDRPSIVDVYQALDGVIPTVNPLGQSNHIANIRNAAPYVIAYLEGVFSGGTYACLGRDSFLISDILSAFYISRGLSDEHVVKLHASTNTVTHLQANNSLQSFLVSNGLGKGALPFVIIDRTSFGRNSQSTTLYNAAVTWLANNNIDTRGVAVASTIAGLSASNYQRQNNSSQSSYQPLQVDMLAQLTDRGFWTNTYGTSIVVDNNGHQRGVPTAAMGHANKVEVLQMLVDTLMVIHDPTFVVTLKQLLSSYGSSLDSISASRSRTSMQPPRARAPASNSINWEQIAAALQPMDHGSKYLSPNGERVVDIIASDLGLTNITLNFSRSIFSAFDRGALSKKDLRRIFLAVAARVKNIADFEFFSKLVSTDKQVRQLLENKGEVFLTSKRYGGHANNVYRALVSNKIIQVNANCLQFFN